MLGLQSVVGVPSRGQSFGLPRKRQIRIALGEFAIEVPNRPTDSILPPAWQASEHGMRRYPVSVLNAKLPLTFPTPTHPPEEVAPASVISGCLSPQGTVFDTHVLTRLRLGVCA